MAVDEVVVVEVAVDEDEGSEVVVSFLFMVCGNVVDFPAYWALACCVLRWDGGVGGCRSGD